MSVNESLTLLATLIGGILVALAIWGLTTRGKK
jgi:hypothetical protein